MIEGYDDPAFDEQARVAWDYLAPQPYLTHPIICKVQKIMTLRQTDLMPHQRGYTRNLSKYNVVVGGRVCPSYWLVDGLLDNWLLDMEADGQTLDPLAMHIRFEKIHPFCDGNGRTGRALLWWHQLQRGLEPTLFLAAEKHEKYYPLFE